MGPVYPAVHVPRGSGRRQLLGRAGRRHIPGWLWPRKAPTRRSSSG